MAKSKPAASKPRRKAASPSYDPAPAKGGGQAAGTAKQAAAKVKGPAVAIGAAAAGVAAARALKGRTGRKTMLGVPVPRSLGGARLANIDVKSISSRIGEASQRFAETSKAVSKDIERAGDQAERIGRMLG